MNQENTIINGLISHYAYNSETLKQTKELAAIILGESAPFQIRFIHGGVLTVWEENEKITLNKIIELVVNNYYSVMTGINPPSKITETIAKCLNVDILPDKSIIWILQQTIDGVIMPPVAGYDRRELEIRAGRLATAYKLEQCKAFSLPVLTWKGAGKTVCIKPARIV